MAEHPGRPRAPRDAPSRRRPPRRQQQNARARQQQRTVESALRPRWQSPAALGAAAVVVVALVVVLIVVLGRGGSGGGGAPVIRAPVPASVLNALTNPNPSVVATVVTGKQPGQLRRVATGSPLTDASGKPEVVYVGAEYCPYCGAERWSLIMALARFGSFSGLQEMTSSSTDVYPNTSTFTFVGSTYTSRWIDFQPTELEDRNEQPLQSPSAQIADLFQAYDTPPYSANTGGYPWLDIGGRYLLYETSYSPQLLQGLSWQQIAGDLSSASSPVTQAIVGNANILAAAICSTSGDQPSSVCSTPTIRSIEPVLKSEPATGG